jgi:hypothetical protein
MSRLSRNVGASTSHRLVGLHGLLQGYIYPLLPYIFVALIAGSAAKAWNVLSRPKCGIVGSNPTQWIYVCLSLFCMCVVRCVGSGFATCWSPVRGFVSTVDRVKKLKKQTRSNRRTVELLIDISLAWPLIKHRESLTFSEVSSLYLQYLWGLVHHCTEE